ncbi:nuclear transport factor 2 family protein [uncultured Tateyamaria sp.]|uniref:nuclear transport factor 2 family protein n=1 Tax=Tateyamaria sp. 1078 TaxID=3417464 RepID=UPI00260A46CA|nr:nuclear transport factor 2 family protein [uncultured Tateyamaria sp.]
MPHKPEILQAWLDRIWTAGEMDAIPEFFSPDATATGILPDMALSATDMPELVQLMRAQLGPIDVRLAKVMDQGDWIAALVEVRSHVIDTGDPVHVFGQIMAQFEGRKMVEVYHSFDFLSYFEQLGQLPPNALALCLTGTRLR